MSLSQGGDDAEGVRRAARSWFTAVEVPAAIGDWASTAWRVSTSERHALVPDGCVDFVWTEDGRLMVCGEEDRGWDFSLSSGRTALGLRLKPGLAAALFRVPAKEIANQQVAAGNLLAGIGRDAEDAMNSVKTDSERLKVLTGLVERLSHDAEPDRPALLGMALLDRQPGLRLAKVAELVGIGERQLRRRIEASFGFPPVTVRRIHRLQAFLRKGRADPSRTITDLAHEVGYYDHQHLVRDAQDIGRASPSALLRQ